MATAANIDVNLRANTGKFEAGMKRGQKRLSGFQQAAKSPVFSKFTKQFSALGFTLGPVAAGLAGVTLATGMLTKALSLASAAVSKNLTELDSVAKTSRKLGFLVSEFQSLSYAAEQLSGVTQGQFAMAMQRMTRRLSEAAAGTGEARAAIKELGLTASDLNAAGPAAAFKQIAEAVQSVKNPADQLRLAFKLFDSEGAALATTLAAGAAEIEKLENKFIGLGGAISELDASSIEAANDAMQDLSTAMSALGVVLTTEVAPSISIIANDLVGAIQTTRGLIDQASSSVSGFATSVAQAGSAASEIMLKGFSGYMFDVAHRSKMAQIEILKAADAAQELADKQANVAMLTAEMTRLDAAAKQLVSRNMTPMEQLQGGMRIANELLGAGAISQDQFTREADRLESVYADAMAAIEDDGAKAFDGIKAKATEAAKGFKDKMADAWDAIVRNPFGSAIGAIADKLKPVAADLLLNVGTTGQVAPAALEAGTQAAFSAFMSNQRKAGKVDERTAKATERTASATEKLLRKGIVLGKAAIGLT